MNNVTPLFLFNDQLEAAIEFHTATLPNSEVRTVARAGTDGPDSHRGMNPNIRCRNHSKNTSRLNIGP